MGVLKVVAALAARAIPPHVVGVPCAGLAGSPFHLPRGWRAGSCYPPPTPPTASLPPIKKMRLARTVFWGLQESLPEFFFANFNVTNRQNFCQNRPGGVFLGPPFGWPTKPDLVISRFRSLQVRFTASPGSKSVSIFVFTFHFLFIFFNAVLLFLVLFPSCFSLFFYVANGEPISAWQRH